MDDLSQAQAEPIQIELPPPTQEDITSFALWRTDLYICTGLAYARSLGRTVEDFTRFVGETHSWESMRGKGLVPPIQLFHFLIKCYPGGEFEITSATTKRVTMKCNRPYTWFFEHREMAGVSVEDFEACLWGHIVLMARRIGLDFTYQVEGERLLLSLSVA